jgi:iron complex outermembrane receptor protein
MSFKRNKLRDAITFALVVGAVGAFGPAFAQDTPAAPAAEGTTPSELDTIVVTGTRIQSQTVTASSPVIEIQPEEFQYAGATRVDDLVNQYPQMSPYFDSFANNPSTGYPTIDLRGLGAQRTLTLVNGNRLAPGALEVRDISMIPASLVKRVDILTGGASAVYGSDAVAGVVNFILNTEFEGVSITAGLNAYQHDNDNDYMQEQLDARGFSYPSGNSGFDGTSTNIDIAVGSSFADGAGHAMAWLTWRKNDPLFQGERDYSSCALSASGIPPNACGGSATNATGNFFIYQPGNFYTSASVDQTTGQFVPHYGAPYNYAPINYYQRPDERYTFGASLKYEINEHFRPYMETMFVNKRDALQIAESGTFFIPIQFNCADPVIGNMCSDLGFDPAGNDLTVYVAKRNIEGGPRHQDTENNSYRFVAGVEGAINDSWSYNTSFLYGHTAQDTQGLNDFLFPRIEQAIRGCPAGSFDGCLPYNVFVPGGVTAEAANALAAVSMNKTDTELKSFNAYVTGDLGWAFPWADGENISVVFGGEWREENYSFQADADSQAGNFAGAGGPATPVSGSTKVAEIFMESAIPVYKGDGLLRSLAFDVGYRLSDYNLSGQANTWKVGFTSDFGMVRARGGFNHAIRAPSTVELFNPQSIALFAGSDPCAGPTPTLTLEQCVNTGLDPSRYGSNALRNSAGQYNQFIGGNPNLRPESADTWTLGFVVTPIDGLQLTLDYYDIKLEDAIAGLGAQNVINACGVTGDPVLCALVHRSATGDIWRGSDPATSGFVVNTNGNFGEQHFSGIDLGASYRWEALGGRMSASLQGTYLLDQEYKPIPGVESSNYDCVGRIDSNCQAPEWRHIANLRYSRDWYTVNLRWRYFGKLDYESSFTGDPLFTDKLLCDEDARLDAGGNPAAPPCRGDGGINAWNYIDLSGSAFIGKNTELTLGVNNIADKEPPLVGVNEALNANSPGGYDQAGRYFFTSVTFKW